MGSPFTGSLWPVGGEEPSFPTHDDETVMNGPPHHFRLTRYENRKENQHPWTQKNYAALANG
jgi:hypothetical protein